MTPEEMWRVASDDEVADALKHLDDYIEGGSAVILSEATRRGLVNDGQASSVLGATEPRLAGTNFQPNLEQLQSEQNLPAAVTAGLLGAVMGAVAWAAITVGADYQSALMAVGVGLVVGRAVKYAGRGIDRVFGVVGAVMSAAGCATGNFLAICGLVANEEGVGILDVVSQLDWNVVGELMAATFVPIDILFYLIAIVAGYRTSFRQPKQHRA